MSALMISSVSAPKYCSRRAAISTAGSSAIPIPLHSTTRRVLQHFKAWREGCLFAGDGMAKPEADAFDIYERGLIRPDLILGDMVRMLHPDLRDEPFVYYRPDTLTVRP